MLLRWAAAPDARAEWQQRLWARLEKRFGRWNYPYRQLQEFVQNPAIEAADWQVHLFGLSYLTPLHHRFFLKLAQQIPVNAYLLSPCMQFWSDLISEKERGALEKRLQAQHVPFSQREALDRFLNDQNPLLANLGKLGREMAWQVEMGAPQPNENYSLPKAALELEPYQEFAAHEIWKEASPFSLLQALQSDLLVLRNPVNSGKLNFARYDGTVQLHACPSRLREVQTLYNTLCSILEAHQNDPEPLRMDQILVMVPNIGEAAPYIQAVFGSEDSQIQFQLMDLQPHAFNPLIKGFLHLLALPESRWEASVLLHLFEFPAFQAKHQLSKEDLNVLRGWIQQTGIFWGKDAQHRNLLLQRAQCRQKVPEEHNLGTWEHGFGRLLDELSRSKSRADDKLEVSEALTSRQGELLGTCMQLFRSLLSDLKPLCEAHLSLNSWSTYMKALCEAYFLPVDQEEQEGYQRLMEQFEAFSRAESCLKEVLFPFSSIVRQLHSALQAQSASLRESGLQGVRFATPLSLRAMPAKVLVMMGMEEGVFPKKDEPLALNLLESAPDADRCPSQSDFDRYLFLEALLSARRYLIVSYVSQGDRQGKESLPSPVVQELLAYLEKTFGFDAGGQAPYHFIHPTHPFDRRYFTPGSPLKSYFMDHYLALCALESPSRKAQHSFLTGFYRASSDKNKEHPLRMDLQELQQFAKNPLKQFLLERFGVYIEKEAEHEEQWALSTLNRYLLSKEGLQLPADQLLAQAEAAGQIPQGPFHAYSREKLLEQITEYKAHLLSHRVVEEQWTTLHFSERLLSQEPAAHHICVGPLLLNLGEWEK